jgi:4a-hydroxytetrahydrobiopterin dehydratase
MAERRRLAEQEIRDALKSLPGWESAGGMLYREYRFGSFIQAFGFMASVALIAESLNHHPDWSNVYGNVVIKLCTHDLEGISTMDIEFARRVNLLTV